MLDQNVVNAKLARRRRTRSAEPHAPSKKDAEKDSVPIPRSGGRDRTVESVTSAVENTNFIMTLARHLGAGKTLKVYVDPDNDAIVKIELLGDTGKDAVKKRSLGPDYHLHVHNPRYWPWSDKWKILSEEEKIEYATTLGVEWAPHDNSRINIMRLTEAVRTHEGIDKYKPEYSTATQRKRAKELYLADQLDMSGDT